MKLRDVFQRIKSGTLPPGWLYLPASTEWTLETDGFFHDLEAEEMDENEVRLMAKQKNLCETLDDQAIKQAVDWADHLAGREDDSARLEVFRYCFRNDAVPDKLGALDPDPKEIQRRSDLEFYNSLGPELANTKCRREGCTRGTIRLSVFCQIHHFEAVKKRPFQPAPPSAAAKPQNISLLEAARQGELEKAKALLKDEPGLIFSNDNTGRTPLSWAASNGHTGMVELLLAYKAEVNVKTTEGYTPLYWAAASGHKEVVELLLAHHADVNTKDKNGWTPLHMAAMFGRRAVVESLLANGADSNARDNAGETSLHTAISNREKGVVALLLTAKADVNARNNRGQTPLQCMAAAKTKTEKALAELLRQHGGRE